MASAAALALCGIFLSVSVDRSAAAPEWTTITAKSGENVTLTCRAPNNNRIIVVEWSRPDLEPQYVLFYRDEQFDPAQQHSFFKNRVDLQMKDGDVSLILKNVTTTDEGTYECRVFMRGTNRRKRANLDGDPKSIIKLSVVPPGPPGGDTEDGGKEDGVSSKHLGLVAIGFFAVTALVISVKLKKKNPPLPPPPDKEADQQLV